MPGRAVVGLVLLLGSAACSPQPAPVSEEPRVATRISADTPTPSAPGAAPSATSAAPSASASVAPTWPPPPSTAQSDFCIEGVNALDDSSCYVLPEAPSDELLIYLHGIVPPTKTSRQKTNFENVVKAAALRANVAALMPRGRVGLAPKGHDGWWGWPTSRGSYQRLAGELVAEIEDKRRKLQTLTGRPFQRLYVAGSSSGAYFVTALLAHQALPAQGYGIISGAADRADVDFAKLPRTPVYIGFGTRDTVGDAARAFGARLERAGFPVKVAAHPLPHGTADVYLDEALAHFRAQRASNAPAPSP